jgi:pimeloyl-ACP methyl ester carboxylesterase
MKVAPVILFFSILPFDQTTRLNTQNNNLMETIKMQYKTTGEGKPLILVPGGLTGWASWEPFVPGFATSNKVVQMQLINVQYGLENKDIPQNYSVRMESNALAESLKEMAISTPIDFISWSFGAFVTLDFALNHPHLVRTLTLIEPPAFWILKAHRRVDPQKQGIMEFMKTLTGDISEDQLEEFMLSVGFAPPGTSLKGHPQWNNWLKFRKSLRNSGQVAVHEDDLSRLKDLNTPVLLVKGTGSAPYLHEIIDLLSQDLPNVETIELAQGHAPHIVSRDKFVSIVREFQNK